MVTNDLKDTVRLLRQCSDGMLAAHHVEGLWINQINELLNDIDNHSNDKDYCDECGELYPDDCVCEEEDYMDDDDFDDDELYGEPSDNTNDPTLMNAFARAKWFRGY